ncbi:MAG: glucuronate isomerase, partial [Anaerolineales bacterium]
MPLHPDRFFPPDPTLRSLARDLYEPIASLPILSPHGHVDPRLFADPNAAFGSPADLFIIPDHYVTRMLYSQGIELQRLGIRELESREDTNHLISNHRVIWELFCTNFHLFRATPSGIWLTHELTEVFGLDEPPSAANADRLFDTLSEKLSSPEFSPRALFERFNIEVLATTDAATDTLAHHQAIRASGWGGRIIPTFRPDGVV